MKVLLHIHTYEGVPKNNENFFLEGRGELFPPAPPWCVYVTARHISCPRGILGEGSTRSVWLFSWASVIAFVDFLMADLKEQRVCIKFCFLLGKTAAVTVTMLLEAFKVEALSQARVYEWFSRFKRGDTSLEDNRDLGVLQQAEPTKTFKKCAMR